MAMAFSLRLPSVLKPAPFHGGQLRQTLRLAQVSLPSQAVPCHAPSVSHAASRAAWRSAPPPPVVRDPPRSETRLPAIPACPRPQTTPPRATSCSRRCTGSKTQKLLKRLDFLDAKFSLYFMGYEDTEGIPENEIERTVWTFSKKATLELTHNWGTESDPDFKGYHTGNSEPRGYGHIGINVDDTYKACERFENLGVEFIKRPDDGKMKGLAFIKDPDGYWIEIFDLKGMERIMSKAT